MGLFDRFTKPKYEHKDWQVRREAVKKLSDQKTLIEIAKNDSNFSVRCAAIRNITDQNVLAEIVKDEEYRRPDEREIALRSITDEKILLNILHTTKLNYIYCQTLEKLDSQYKEPLNISEIENSTDKEYLLYILNLLGIDSDYQEVARKKFREMGYIIDNDVHYPSAKDIDRRVMIDEYKKRIYLVR